MVRRTETEPIDRDEQLGEAIEAYLALAEAGPAPDVEEFASRYPDLGDDLQAALEGLALVRGLVGESGGGGGPGHRLESGRRIAGYRIVRVLGRGGMGTVYEAVHVGLDRPVALKVLGNHAAPDSTGRRRFLNEARTAAGLHHTHIVPVFDVGQVGGLCYYAMQRIEGSGLDRVLRHLRRDRSIAAGSGSGQATPRSRSRSRTTPTAAASVSASGTEPHGSEEETITWLSQAGQSGLAGLGKDHDDDGPPYDPPRGSAYYRWVAEVGREAAEALAHAHRRGIIHRDVKPSNLLVDARGIVWVADFGLARRLADPGLTHHDSLLGTPRYMSPEQARTGPIDGRTDVYSLGATLYELLTLRPPFEGQTAAELVEQTRAREPAALRQYDPRIPRDLETIVLKTLAKRPNDRYPTAAELAEDLERFLNHEPVRARRIGPLGRAWRYARRHPSLTAVSSVALAAVLATATAAYVRVVQERDQARLATAQSLVFLRDAQTAMRKTQDANRKTESAMRDLLLSQAQVMVRNSHMPGRRRAGLRLIQEAAALGPDPVLRSKLRDEAVEALVLRDVENRSEIRTGPGRAIVFGPDDARLATLSDGGDEFTLWNLAERSVVGRHRLVNASMPGRIPMFRMRPALVAAGEYLVAASADGRRIYLFDAATGEPIRPWTLDGQHRRVLSLSAVAGGRRLVTIETDFVPAAQAPNPAPRPDGGRGEDGRGEGRRGPDGPRGEWVYHVRLYDLASFDKPIATLEQWTSRSSQSGRDLPLVAIAPDGATVATARGRDATLRDSAISIWSTEDGEQLGDPLEAQSELSALALGPDGLLAVAGGGEIRLWEVGTRTSLPSLNSYQSYVRQLRFNPKGTLLAVAGPTLGVELWDPAAHAVVAMLKMSDQAHDLAFSSDGRTLAAVSQAATTSVWSIADPVARTQISGFDSLPTSLAFGSDGRLAMGSWRGTVRVWEPGHCPSTTRQVEASRLPGGGGSPARHDRPVSLLFDHDDRLIAADVDDLPHSFNNRRSPRGQRGGPPPETSGGFGKLAITQTSDARTLFAAQGSWILVWSADDPNWKPLDWPGQSRFEGPGAGPGPRPRPGSDSRRRGESKKSRGMPFFLIPRSLAASPKGDRLYLIDLSGHAYALAVDGLKARLLPWDLPGEATCLAVSPDGATLALGDKKGNVALVNTAQGRVTSLLTLPASETEGRARALAFAPGRPELAVGTEQGHVELWSLADTSAPLLRLPGHRGYVSALAYDDAGRHLATSGSDKLVEVWDLHRIRAELNRLGLGW
jgi:serine/threonine protein kinase/WD40 repeat protein